MSLAETNLRDRWFKCRNGLVSTTFNTDGPPLLTLNCNRNLRVQQRLRMYSVNEINTDHKQNHWVYSTGSNILYDTTCNDNKINETFNSRHAQRSLLSLILSHTTPTSPKFTTVKYNVHMSHTLHRAACARGQEQDYKASRSNICQDTSLTKWREPSSYCL